MGTSAVSDEPILSTAHTDELDVADERAAEALVRAAFGDRFSQHDWVHALGGTHVILRIGERIVGHAAIVPRLLAHDGAEFDGSFVEAVALDAEFRGRGLGAAVMDAVEAAISADDVLGVLNSLPDAVGFYEARGWVRWRGLLGAIGHCEDPAPPEEGHTVMVFRPPATIDVDGVLSANNRVGPRW